MSGSIRTRLPRPRGIRRARLRKPSTWWRSLAARQDEAFRNIWQALRQHGYVVTGTPHPPSWSERADSFVICAIRIPLSDELRQSFIDLHDALSGFPFIELYPPDSLHITIQELGFLVDNPGRSDEISSERVEEFIRLVSVPICDFPAFNVTIGGFNSFLDAPFLDVLDNGWCFRIHHRLRDFIVSQPDDTFAYLPHIVLGRYTRTSDMDSLPARMAPWRDHHFSSFVAQAVDVLEVSTRDPQAAPNVLHSFELGQQVGAAESITTAPNEIF